MDPTIENFKFNHYNNNNLNYTNEYVFNDNTGQDSLDSYSQNMGFYSKYENINQPHNQYINMTHLLIPDSTDHLHFPSIETTNTTSTTMKNQYQNIDSTLPFHEYNFIADSTKKENVIKESILLAVSQLSLCDVPLKKQIFESLLIKDNENVNESKRLPKFQEFMKIEKNPTLYPIEHEKLKELKDACLLLRSPYEEIVNETNRLADAIQMTEAAIRRLIKMSNKLSSFNRLIQNDKISLLKNSIIEMLCIRATTNFNSETNFWCFIDDKNKGLSLVSMEVLKAAQINFMSHKEFAIKFNTQFRNDPMIADLLTAIILFRPSRASVSNPDVVKEEFFNYCYLLRRYLQVKYKGETCLAKNSFITLMHRLEELHHLSEEIVHLYLDLNPQNATQLFVELFDLK